MKKPLLIFAAVLMAGVNAYGQFTESNFPTLGETQTMFVLDSTAASYENETGSDAVWDYSETAGETGLTNEITLKDASTMDYASDYPSSAFALDIENYLKTYMNNSAADRSVQGFVFPDPTIGDVIVTFEDDEATYFEYPFNLGDEVQDDYKGSVKVDLSILGIPGLGVTTLDATGSMTATFDGIGTLKLAEGDFENVYRYKIEEEASANVPLFGAAVITRVQYEYYDFSEGNLPIFIHSTMKFDIPTFNNEDKTVVMSFGDPDADSGDDTAGIPAHLMNSVNVYPNPTKGQVNINLAAINGEASVAILDNLGKTVYTAELNTTKELIDVSSLNSGVYFVNITNGTEKSVQKLIVR